MKLLRLAPLALPAALVLLARAPATQAETPPTPACIHSRGEARARAVGYDHVVTIENRCEKTAECVISTDVAPEPLTATVEAKKTVELTTFRGSPASAFTPKVACKLR